MSNTEVSRSKSRIVEIIGNEIVYTRRRDGIKDYATYNETLYNILTRGRLNPTRSDGRLKFVIWNKCERSFYFHDLVLACELGYITDAEDFRTGLNDFIQYKSINEKTVDHADSNIHNNTFLNLSLISRSLNARKSDIVKRFKHPYNLSIAYCAGEYRLIIVIPTVVKITTPRGTSYGLVPTETKLMCSNPEDLVSCLNELYTARYEWSPIMESPKEYLTKAPTTPHWTEDTLLAITQQKDIARMELSNFNHYNPANGLLIPNEFTLIGISGYGYGIA